MMLRGVLLPRAALGFPGGNGVPQDRDPLNRRRAQALGVRRNPGFSDPRVKRASRVGDDARKLQHQISHRKTLGAEA